MASPTNKTTAPNLWLVLYIRFSPLTGKITARNAPPTAPPIWPARLIPGIRTLPIMLTTKVSDKIALAVGYKDCELHSEEQ